MTIVDIQSTAVQFTFIFETEICFLPIDLQTDSLTDGLTRQFLITLTDRPTNITMIYLYNG